MAARKYSYMESVQGSTARKLESAPLREEYQNSTLQSIERVERQKKIHPIQSIDVFSLLFMTAAVAVTLYLCLSYVQVQYNITSMSKQIAIKESEINDLKNQNNAAYNRIDTSIDLNYVYNVAVKELGMVRADQSQIMKYASVKSDYVRQYGNIPDEEKSTLERAITKNSK